MTSILKVDTIQDADGNNIINESGNTITIGASGDTTNIVGTLQNNGAGVGGVNEVLFFAYRSASDGQQTIGGGSNVKILLPTELYDTANAFSSSRFTVPSGKGGYYYLQGKLRDDFSGNHSRELMIWKNGSALIMSREYSYDTTRHYTHVSGVFNLSASDYIEMYTYHSNSGTNRGIDGTDQLETSLMGYRLIT
jgi:hypothetical protein